ncbi:hypothetical protein SMMN14_09062 [Sphaerulina musiva]
MKSFLLTSLLSPLLTYAASPANPFSNYFLIGFADNGPLIRSVTTVLVLPPIDQNQTGFLKVYPELATKFDKGGSVTGTGIALLDDRNPCPNNLQDWCVGARLVFGDAQNSGDYAPAPVGSKLGVSITYDPPSKKHNIAVTVNGKLVSSLPPTSPDNLEVGRAIGFRTQIECQLDPCGTVNKHEYLDTRVVLDKKDMSFGDTAVGNKAKATWKTPDGGLTWTADKIVVEAHTYA